MGMQPSGGASLLPADSKAVWIGGTALLEPSSYDGVGNGVLPDDVTDVAQWRWYPEFDLGSFAELPYTNWNRNEPNNGGGGQEGCLAIWTKDSLDGGWNNRKCKLPHQFMCENARPV